MFLARKWFVVLTGARVFFQSTHRKTTKGMLKQERAKNNRDWREHSCERCPDADKFRKGLKQMSPLGAIARRLFARGPKREKSYCFISFQRFLATFWTSPRRFGRVTSAFAHAIQRFTRSPTFFATIANGSQRFSSTMRFVNVISSSCRNRSKKKSFDVIGNSR